MTEAQSRQQVKAQIVKILSGLTPPEQKLFGLVMKLESENLHLKQPRLKGELLDAVKRAIK